MNDDNSLDPDVAPRPRTPKSRSDLAPLCVALLALAVALHARLYPSWPRAEGKRGSPEAVVKRLQESERRVRELQESQGQRDAHGRADSDRLLVAHVRTREDSLPSPARSLNVSRGDRSR